MLRSKYIVTNRLQEQAIVFSELLGHDDVLNQMGLNLKDVISAGFVSLGLGDDYRIRVSAYGKSISLKVESRPEDTILLEKALGIYDPYNY